MGSSSTEVFKTIFDSSTSGLSLFSNNAFRRHKPEEGHVDTSRTQISVEKIRVSDNEELGKTSKKIKHKGKQTLAEPLPSQKGQTSSHSYTKKTKVGKSSDLLFKEPSSPEAQTSYDKGLRGSDKTVSKKKSDRDLSVEKQMVCHAVERNRPHSAKHAKLTNGPEGASKERKGSMHVKRAFSDASESQKPTKKQKTNSEDGFKGRDSVQESLHELQGHISLKSNAGVKRKREDSLEARYEKKLRGSEHISSLAEEPKPNSAKQDRKNEGKVTSVQSKKRKRDEGDDEAVETTDTRKFDEDDKLKRTIFIGNLPLSVNKKAIIKEFSAYGAVESVRIRSVPLLDTKIPRKGAIIKGQINKAIDCQHAYVVFKEISHASAAHAHNMKEFNGNHLRVDAAIAPCGAVKGKPSLLYDHRRSIFVGNIPFDVKDEELYQAFGVGKSPELDIEAIRVVRDSQTSLSKGIAYVLFKTKAGASFFLSSKRKVKLRDRILRITRVQASQRTQKPQSPLNKRVRESKDMDSSQVQRKRAKLSASYEGVRATKDRREGKEKKQKGASRTSGQFHVTGSPKGKANSGGAKRKRVENRQRGISRSKKIRRT